MRLWSIEAYLKRNKDIERMITKVCNKLNICGWKVGYFAKHEKNQAGGHVHLLFTCPDSSVNASQIAREMQKLWFHGIHRIEPFKPDLKGVEYVCQQDDLEPYDYPNKTLLKMMKKTDKKPKRIDSRRYEKQPDGTYRRGNVLFSRDYSGGPNGRWIKLCHVDTVKASVDTAAKPLDKVKSKPLDTVKINLIDELCAAVDTARSKCKLIYGLR